MRIWSVASDYTLDVDGDPPSIVRPTIDRRIDELLYLATTDRAKALQQSRRFREWLKRKIIPRKRTLIFKKQFKSLMP